MGKMKVLNSNLVYDDFLKVYEEEVLLENGITHKFCLINQKNAAAVLPITTDNKVILVEQYRHGLKENMLEIPAGILEDDESYLECAKRELLEETGYTTKDIEFLCNYCPSAGVTNELVEIFLAKNVQKIGDLELDETEIITVHEYTLDEVITMINNGSIKDSKTMISILKYKLNL